MISPFANFIKWNRRVSALSLAALGLGAALLLPSSAEAAVTVLPRVPDDSTWDEKGIATEPARPDKRYFVELKVDGLPLPIHRSRFPRHNYVHFVTDGPVKVSMRFNADHADSVLIPMCATMKIRPVRIDGKNFEYHLQPGDYLYLARLDLYIIANKPLKYAPKETDPEVVSTASLGIDNTGKGEQAAKINAAIEQISKSGGAKKTLYFPPGIYNTGTVMLKSNVTVFLAAGSLLRASKDPTQWITKKDMLGNAYQEDGSGLVFAWSEGADTIRNANLCGFGALDGMGNFWRSEAGRPANATIPYCNEPYCWDYDKTGRSHVIFFVGTRNSEAREVSVRNPVFNNVRLYGAQRSQFSDLKIFGDWKVNNDGMVMDHCQDCKFSNSIVASGDDGFCFKNGFAWGYKEPSRRDTLHRLVLLTGYPGFKIGWAYHQVFDIHIEDCYFRGGFKIEPKKVFWRTWNNKPIGVSDSVIVRNMTFKNCDFGNYWTIKNLNPGDIKSWVNENFTFIDCTVNGSMDATDSRNFKFINLRQGKTLATDAASAKLTLGANTSGFTFQNVPVAVRIPLRPSAAGVRASGAAGRATYDLSGRKKEPSLGYGFWRPAFLKPATSPAEGR